jgi:hypothetical protein
MFLVFSASRLEPGSSYLTDTSSDSYDWTSSMLANAQFNPPLVVVLIALSLIVAISPLFVSTKVLFAIAGVIPFILSHPTVFPLLDPLFRMHSKEARSRLRQIMADDRLRDEHWLYASKTLREVELFENERWAVAGTPQWSKMNLKEGERLAWTRGSDGWSPVGGRTEEEGSKVRSVFWAELIALRVSSML